MGTYLLALTLLFITVNALPSIRVQKGIYGEFQKKFGRTFSSKLEEDLRFDIFSKRLQRIEELNKLHKADNVTFGITKFTDWTREERSKFFSPVKGIRNKALPTKIVRKPALPESFDWRSQNGVTAVKDQGDCASCWAFSATAVVESLQLILAQKNLDLSEQFLVDCDTSNAGCNGGWYDTALQFFSKKGQLLESEYPYTATDGHVCPNTTAAPIISDVWQVGVQPDDIEIASFVIDHGPVAVYYGVPEDFLDYVSGVYNPSVDQCDYTVILGYHGVTIVGFGVEGTKKYWIVKNSWGPTWGEEGFFKIIRGVNACLIEDYPVGAKP